MHYLITGHTGFKGAWLALWLTEAGHTVSGLALDPIPGSLFDKIALHRRLANDLRADIRDNKVVQEALGAARPDIVIHMAAQPLVRESYRSPRYTVETNVMGTLNVLDAVGRTDSVQAHLVVTTDKVYRNVCQQVGYVESDPLGGDDPYSSSKAMADILTQSWTASFDSPPTAIARAGNVIGGGDNCADRLLPDLLRAFSEGRPAVVRYPHAIRPWQHVLDCLRGYLMLTERLMAGGTGGAWNFGSPPHTLHTVGEVASLTAQLWGDGASWQTDEEENFAEAKTLTLDASKASQELGWHDLLDFETAIKWVVAWEKALMDESDCESITLAQLATYMSQVP